MELGLALACLVGMDPDLRRGDDGGGLVVCRVCVMVSFLFVSLNSFQGLGFEVFESE